MEERVHNQTQKIVLNNGFYDELIEAIQVNNDFANNLPEESRKVIIDRNVRIQDKLDKYKKINEDNEVYYYFYQRELKDLFWILIENYTNLKK
jgi:hypothetical protein